MVGYSSFVTPNGNVAPLNSSGNYVALFSNTAQFTEPCQAREYRQYVKGAFMANGTAVTHVLCGSIVLDSTFREDGCPPGSSGVRAYGYRSGAGDAYDLYSPSRATGCGYKMTDTPGFNNVQKGTRYSIDLSFRGTLIDSGQEMVRQEWTARGQLGKTEDVMTAVEPKRAVPLDKSDRIVGAHHAFNLDGKPELHIVVARPSGRPPLDPKSWRVELKDAKGAPIPVATPEVHEVGNRRSATATILFALRDDRLPVKAVLVIGKDKFPLPVAVH